MILICYTCFSLDNRKVSTALSISLLEVTPWLFLTLFSIFQDIIAWSAIWLTTNTSHVILKLLLEIFTGVSSLFVLYFCYENLTLVITVTFLNFSSSNMKFVTTRTWWSHFCQDHINWELPSFVLSCCHKILKFVITHAKCFVILTTYPRATQLNWIIIWFNH